MPENGFPALREGPLRALDHAWPAPDPQKPASDPRAPSSGQTAPSDPKTLLARDILAADSARRAWFTMAHLLADPGARVAVLGSGDGAIAHAMADAHPEIKIVGVDPDRRAVDRARSLPNLPNLEFRVGNLTHPPFEDESLDVVVNAFTLHSIYSRSPHAEQAVQNALKMHLSLLRPGGLMFVQDHLSPAHDGFVLLEIDEPLDRDNPATPPVADNLLWYAEHAHPAQDPSAGGFYIEDRNPRFPRTRLFRLPYKWAIEFILRPHDRASLEQSIGIELACFTKSDFRKHLRALGARVLYSAPHTDEALVRQRMARCRLYTEQGTLLPPPVTSLLTVLRKTEEGESTLIQERRPSKAASGKLRICALRDEKDGRVVDVLIPDRSTVEILPWRMSAQGRPSIFVHEGVARGIVNTIPRLGANLDDREWSGHMVEAISVEESAVRDAEAGGVRDIVRFCVSTLGLRPEIGQTLEPGQDFYPAPDFIDECIRTRYLRVAEDNPASYPAPRSLRPRDETAEGGQSGRIREVDAQMLLDAVSVGYIPNARLEIQILRLFDRLGIKPRSWATCPLVLNRIDSLPLADLDALEKALKPLPHEPRQRFKPSKWASGQLKVMHSIFVEEGRSRSGITGLAAHDRDFVLPDDSTVNIAVVLPLAMKVSGEVMAGVVMKYLPVPERYAGNGNILSLPSFTLPPEVKNVFQARKFIADQFEVGVEHVAKMGESYFSHYALTPQRIYPFAVSVPIPNKYKVGYFQHGPIKIVQFGPLRGLLYMIWKSMGETPLLKTIAQSYQMLGFDNDGMGVETSFGLNLSEAKATPVSASHMEFIGESNAYKAKRTPQSLQKDVEPPSLPGDRIEERPTPGRD